MKVACVALPEHYCCPITLDVLTDAVRAPDGFVYERKAIERWRATGSAVRSPSGGFPMPPGPLVPVRALMREIAQHAVAGPLQRAAQSAQRSARCAWWAWWAAAACGTAAALLGAGLGSLYQRGVQSLRGATLDLPVGAVLGATWGGFGGGLWAFGRTCGDGTTDGQDLLITGVFLLASSAGFAALFGATAYSVWPGTDTWRFAALSGMVLSSVTHPGCCMAAVVAGVAWTRLRGLPPLNPRAWTAEAAQAIAQHVDGAVIALMEAPLDAPSPVLPRVESAQALV